MSSLPHFRPRRFEPDFTQDCRERLGEFIAQRSSERRLGCRRADATRLFPHAAPARPAHMLSCLPALACACRAPCLPPTLGAHTLTPSFSPCSHPPLAEFFRLDSVIRKRCVADIKRHCGVGDDALVQSVEMLGPTLTVSEDSISKCLQDHRCGIPPAGYCVTAAPCASCAAPCRASL